MPNQEAKSHFYAQEKACETTHTCQKTPPKRPTHRKRRVRPLTHAKENHQKGPHTTKHKQRSQSTKTPSPPVLHLFPLHPPPPSIIPTMAARLKVTTSSKHLHLQHATMAARLKVTTSSKHLHLHHATIAARLKVTTSKEACVYIYVKQLEQRCWVAR